MFTHIDGDILKYRCAAACQKNEYYLTWYDETYDEETTAYFRYHADMRKFIKAKELDQESYTVDKVESLEPVENAFYNVRSMIKTALRETGAEDWALYLSGKSNFRDDVATIQEYKGNRKDMERPAYYDDVEQYMLRTYDVVLSDGEEADDVISYTHYRMYEDDPYSSCIATIDKDLDMVPGLHYNIVTQVRYFVSPEQGLRNFYTQLITGDPTDNIPGCRGAGPAAARDALDGLEDERDLYNAAFALYVQSYGEENALAAITENGILLWMRREEGEIWAPPLLT